MEGEVAHELEVKVGAEADGGEADAVAVECAAHGDDVGGGGVSGGGLAVAEEDDAVLATAVVVRKGLLEACGEAVVDVGAAVGGKGGGDVAEFDAVVDDGVHFKGDGGVVGVGDDGDLVFVAQAVDELAETLADEGDFVAAHGAGDIDDNREREGGALGGVDDDGGVEAQLEHGAGVSGVEEAAHRAEHGLETDALAADGVGEGCVVLGKETFGVKVFKLGDLTSGDEGAEVTKVLGAAEADVGVAARGGVEARGGVGAGGAARGVGAARAAPAAGVVATAGARGAAVPGVAGGAAGARGGVLGAGGAGVKYFAAAAAIRGVVRTADGECCEGDQQQASDEPAPGPESVH